VKSHFLVFLFFLLTTVAGGVLAQAELSPAELFRRARLATFVQKDYPEALRLVQLALQKTPDNAPMRILLSRVYMLTNKREEAREELDIVLKRNPQNREALNQYIELEYAATDPAAALSYINKALEFYPQDEEYMLKKAQALYDVKDYPEAFILINDILVRYPHNPEAKALATQIRTFASLDQITLSYDFFYFNKNYNSALNETPWHIANIAYGHRTNRGIVIGRVNYANRFGSSGLQVEAEAYPRISPRFYSYVNVGYSGNEPIFPRFRAGYSLYANLPQSYEADLGLRYLRFSSATWIYTASAGKYFSNYWFNLRTYLVPGIQSLSHSYTFTTRYYFDTADDFLSVAIGSGISPDENRSILLDRPQQLSSRKVDVWYSSRINKVNVLLLTGTWFNEAQPDRARGTQLSFGIMYQRRF
jgi:YaiO family outer membrane protein